MQNSTKEDQTILMRIQRNDIVGRYAIASSDLNPGDVIFSETPFAFGPKADSPPVCLGCYSPVDGSAVCTLCKWPVCGKNCEVIPAHKNAECGVFSKARARFQPVEDFTAPSLQYECVTPLRVLLATLSDPERWNQEVKQMEAHNRLRKEKPTWRFNQINIVNYLRGPCKLKDVFDEELIHTVCGILESNAFEARSFAGNAIRCLYPKLAILSHNCVSNINHSINCTGLGDTNDYRVTVRATTKIKRDNELFSSYTYSLWPTLMRRAHLRDSKYFDCCCARCSDPTELGTHMSTVKCRCCDDGMVISTQPLDAGAEWKCSNCGKSEKGDDIKALFAAIQGDIDVADSLPSRVRPEILSKMLRKYDRILHCQNAYSLILRLTLIQNFGKLDENIINNNGETLIEGKLEYCKHVLKILDVVEPGYSRIRGVTLYELYTALLHVATVCQADKENLRIQLRRALIALEESSAILSLEPGSTLEGKIGVMALKSLTQFHKHFEQLVDGKLKILNLMLK